MLQEKIGLPAVPGEAGLVVLPRRGKPPLRFRAALLCRHHCAGGSGPAMEIALWRRPGAGYALSLTRVDGGAVVADALQAADPTVLAEWLEQEALPAPATRRRKGRSPLAPGDLLPKLLDRQREAELLREFRALVGEALADWESAVPLAPAPATGKAP